VRKDLYVPFSKMPYCLSAELQAETLPHMVAAWCGQGGAAVPRAECGAYTVISRHGHPSAPLHGSESIYFDRTGHLVGRASSSNEWGPRTEGARTELHDGCRDERMRSGQVTARCSCSGCTRIRRSLHRSRVSRCSLVPARIVAGLGRDVAPLERPDIAFVAKG
jgi:hypothetical protein